MRILVHLNGFLSKNNCNRTMILFLATLYFKGAFGSIVEEGLRGMRWVSSPASRKL
jgi:hypothetical protein